MAEMNSVKTPMSGKSAELCNEGWMAYSKKEYDRAVGLFNQAIIADQKSIEANYGLGVVLKQQDRREEAVKAFKNVLELIGVQVEDRSRAEMLRRLTLAHINMIQKGEWGLEAEIWMKGN